MMIKIGEVWLNPEHIVRIAGTTTAIIHMLGGPPLPLLGRAADDVAAEIARKTAPPGSRPWRSDPMTYESPHLM
jgi:hypothetical protein